MNFTYFFDILLNFFRNINFLDWKFYIFFIFFFLSVNLIQIFLEKKYLKIEKINKIKKKKFILNFIIAIIAYLFFYSFFLIADFLNIVKALNYYQNLIYFEIFISFIISLFLYSFWITDLKYKFIPNFLNYFLMFWAFLFSSILMIIIEGNISFDLFLNNFLLNNFLQAFFVSAPFFLIYYYSDGKTMGGADWKIIFSLSLILGNFNISYIFLTISFVIGAFFAIFLFIKDFLFFDNNKDNKTRNEKILPVAPFLIFGFIVTFIFKMAILLKDFL